MNTYEIKTALVASFLLLPLAVPQLAAAAKPLYTETRKAHLYVSDAQNAEKKGIVGPDVSRNCNIKLADGIQSMVEPWYEEMQKHSAWEDNDTGGMVQHFYPGGDKIVNGHLDPTHLCDPRFDRACEDYRHVDGADAALIALHGVNNGDHWVGMLPNEAKSADGSTLGCRVHAPESDPDAAPRPSTLMPGYQLRYLHVMSCNSMDPGNMNSISRMFNRKFDVQTMSNLRIITGFHGAAAIWDDYTEHYRQTARRGFSEGIITAWQSEHHDWPLYAEGWFEQCPVSVAMCGSTEPEEDCIKRLSRETYWQADSPEGRQDEDESYAMIFAWEGCAPLYGEPWEFPS